MLQGPTPKLKQAEQMTEFWSEFQLEFCSEKQLTLPKSLLYEKESSCYKGQHQSYNKQDSNCGWGIRHYRHATETKEIEFFMIYSAVPYSYVIYVLDLLYHYINLLSFITKRLTHYMPDLCAFLRQGSTDCWFLK